MKFDGQALRENWRVIALAAAGAFFVGFVVGGSTTDRDCIYQHTNQDTYNAKREGSGVVGDKVAVGKTLWIHWSCAGEFAESNGEAITGVFTIVLALSTIFLWNATKRTAEISERTLNDLERPWLFATVEPGIGLRQQGSGGQYMEVGYTISNHGRFPAVIEDIGVSLGISDFPVDGERPDGVPQFIPPAKTLEPLRKISETYFGRETEPVHVPRAGYLHIFKTERSEDIIFYVQIRYTGVDPASVFVSDFCWRWSRDTDGWESWDEYNQRT